MIVPGVLVTVSVLPDVLNVACPLVTVPPIGLASAPKEQMQASAMITGFGHNLNLPKSPFDNFCKVSISRIRLDADRLPLDLVISETATQAPSDSDQIVR